MNLRLGILSGMLLLASAVSPQAPVPPPVSPGGASESGVRGPAAPNPSLLGSSVQNPAPPANANLVEQHSTPATSAGKYSAPSNAVFCAILASMTGAILVGIVLVGVRLRSDKDWTFAVAMSEADGKPSVSRLIAFLGLLIIVSLILGVGYSSLWVFLQAGQAPRLGGMSTFLLACAGLFTPYFANQISHMFGASIRPLIPSPGRDSNSKFRPSIPNIELTRHSLRCAGQAAHLRRRIRDAN